MTTNRYMETINKRPTPQKKKLFSPANIGENNNSFVTRDELANFSEQILGSFQVIFQALDENANQSAYNTDTIESLVNAIEALNSENEKRHRELIATLEKLEKLQKLKK